MSQLSIIVCIDVNAVVKNGKIDGNYYLIDNNRIHGSTGQGTENLVSRIIGTRVVNWLCYPVAPLISSPPPPTYISAISGEAVEEQVLVPRIYESPDFGDSKGQYWAATVDSNDKSSEPVLYEYTMEIKIGELTEIITSTLSVSPETHSEESLIT